MCITDRLLFTENIKKKRTCIPYFEASACDSVASTAATPTTPFKALADFSHSGLRLLQCPAVDDTPRRSNNTNPRGNYCLLFFGTLRAKGGTAATADCDRKRTSRLFCTLLLFAIGGERAREKGMPPNATEHDILRTPFYSRGQGERHGLLQSSFLRKRRPKVPITRQQQKRA